MTVQIAVMQVLTGFSVGMVLFLIASGLSIIFGTLKIINLAHGSIYMFGTFLCFWLTSTFFYIPGIFWWALFLAPIITALLGGLIEIFLLRRIYDEHELYTYILTFGLILIVGDICKLIWGVAYHTVSAPWPVNGVMSILGMYFPVYNLFLIGCGIVVFICITCLMRYTGLGRTIRAVTYNREAASSLGLNAPRVFTAVFMLGCWLAGLP